MHRATNLRAMANLNSPNTGHNNELNQEFPLYFSLWLSLSLTGLPKLGLQGFVRRPLGIFCCLYRVKIVNWRVTKKEKTGFRWQISRRGHRLRRKKQGTKENHSSRGDSQSAKICTTPPFIWLLWVCLFCIDQGIEKKKLSVKSYIRHEFDPFLRHWPVPPQADFWSERMYPSKYKDCKNTTLMKTLGGRASENIAWAWFYYLGALIILENYEGRGRMIL